MEFSSLFKTEFNLNGFFDWINGTAAGASGFLDFLNAPENKRGLGMFMIVSLGLGLVIEVMQRKNSRENRAMLVSYRTNLTLFVLNNIVLSLLSVTALYSVAENHAFFGSIGKADLSILGWFIAFLLIDFFLYLWHLANHRIPLLWTFHKIHHSDKSMNVTTALRFHAGELVLTTAFKALLILLLRIPVEVILTTEAIIACFTLFHHLNVRFNGERILKWIFIVPHLHRVHHSTKRSEHDNNFGSVFSIWDRAFGTLHDMIPDNIGLSVIPEQSAWQTFCYGLPWATRLNSLPALASKREDAGITESVGVDKLTATATEHRHRPIDLWANCDPLDSANTGSDFHSAMESSGSGVYRFKPVPNSPCTEIRNFKNWIELSAANIDFVRELTESAWHVGIAMLTVCSGTSTDDSAIRAKNNMPSSTIGPFVCKSVAFPETIFAFSVRLSHVASRELESSIDQREYFHNSDRR